MATRVLLVDDQALVRRGFRMILESEPDIVVVGEAGDGRQAIDSVRRLRPDVTLMDIQMPGMDGLEATRRLLDDPSDGPANETRANETRVLILTTFERDDYVFEALRLGASGFLLKTAPPEDLVTAVRVVARGDALLSPSVTRRMIQFARRHRYLAPPAEVERLTQRETEVLRQVAQGLSNGEIGQELYVSEATVKTHVSSILSKLHLRDRVQAVIFAYEHGLVEPGAGGAHGR
jgi:DNA-binding NarL/FixJ family response regulator